MRLEPSWRQPFGILLILLLIAGWAVLVATASTLIEDTPQWVQVLYYVVAGIVWILPLKPLLRWMETGRFRGSPQPPSAEHIDRDAWRE